MNACPADDKPPVSTIHRGRLSLGAFLLTIGLNGHSIAHASDSTATPDSQVDELEVTTRKQTALDSEAISLSDTPDAEPSVGGKTSIVVGLAAREAPVYDGAKKNKVSPFPYVDIHGLFHDRVFISDIRGIGFNVVDLGAFRTGISVNYGGGRTSSDSPRLQGLPDIKTAAGASAFMTYAIRPFAFELKVQRELGSQPATEVQLGASVAMAPNPRWHVSVGTQLNWRDGKYNQKYFGVTPAEAAQATVLGNLLTAYDPKSSLGTIGITSTSVYAMTEHWGLVTRLGFRDLIGSAEKNSPLAQRTFGVDFALGAIYKF